MNNAVNFLAMAIMTAQLSTAAAQVGPKTGSDPPVALENEPAERAKTAVENALDEETCRTLAAISRLKQRNELIDRAIGLLRDKKVQEANAAFERLRKFDETSRASRPSECWPEILTRTAPPVGASPADPPVSTTPRTGQPHEPPAPSPSDSSITDAREAEAAEALAEAERRWSRKVLANRAPNSTSPTQIQTSPSPRPATAPAGELAGSNLGVAATPKSARTGSPSGDAGGPTPSGSIAAPPRTPDESGQVEERQQASPRFDQRLNLRLDLAVSAGISPSASRQAAQGVDQPGARWPGEDAPIAGSIDRGPDSPHKPESPLPPPQVDARAAPAHPEDQQRAPIAPAESAAPAIKTPPAVLHTDRRLASDSEPPLAPPAGALAETSTPSAPHRDSPGPIEVGSPRAESSPTSPEGPKELNTSHADSNGAAIVAATQGERERVAPPTPPNELSSRADNAELAQLGSIKLNVPLPPQLPPDFSLGPNEAPTETPGKARDFTERANNSEQKKTAAAEGQPPSLSLYDRPPLHQNLELKQIGRSSETRKIAGAIVPARPSSMTSRGEGRPSGVHGGKRRAKTKARVFARAAHHSGAAVSATTTADSTKVQTRLQRTCPDIQANPEDHDKALRSFCQGH